MILSGGISPTVFRRTGSDGALAAVVCDWLRPKEVSPRLILAAGDQVPSGTPWERVAMLTEMVERYGYYP